jgi:hypothetical protein
MESDDPKKKGSHTTYRPSRLRDSRHEAIPSPQKKASAKAVNSQDTYFQEDVIDLANSEGEGENESENGGGVIPPNIRVAMKNQLFERPILYQENTSRGSACTGSPTKKVHRRNYPS